jgi:hypothetical protein
VNFKNFAVTTLAAGIDNTTTSISVTDATKLPTAPFIAVVWNATDYPDIVSDPNVEIVYVTSVSSNTLTVIRGYDGTTASVHNATGKTYKIANILNAGIENDIKTFIDSKGAANGLATLDANGKVVQDPVNAGLNDGQICRLPTATVGQVLTRGTSGWIAQTPSGGGFTSRVSAYLSTNQTIENNTTIVSFNAIVFDGNNEFNTTTHEFTASSSGYYLVIANVLYYNFSPDNAASAYIYKNNSYILQNTSHTGAAYNNLGIALYTVLYLAAGDYIDIRTATIGGSILLGGLGNTSLFIHRLS